MISVAVKIPVQRTFVIYGLFDPHSDECRYIGQTCDSAKRRARYDNPRFWRSQFNLQDWLLTLKIAGHPYVWKQLAECATADHANRMERAHIRLHREHGSDLLNVASGGKARNSRRASRIPEIEWLKFGRRIKCVHAELTALWIESPQLFPRSSKACLKLQHSLRAMRRSIEAMEDQLEAEHPTWDVIGLFNGSPHHARTRIARLSRPATRAVIDPISLLDALNLDPSGSLSSPAPF